MRSRFKRRRPLYIAILFAVILIAVYFWFRRFYPSLASELLTGILAIVAGVAFWLEYHHNSKINEGQFVMELNEQFIANERMSFVEHELEKYNAKVMAETESEEDLDVLRTLFDLNDGKRQHLVNYLVHLEGVAALVNNGVLRLSAITDLMAYRYFIAVNNPVVQELEIIPYRDYYQGIIQLFPDWERKVKGKMPLGKFRLDKVLLAASSAKTQKPGIQLRKTESA